MGATNSLGWVVEQYTHENGWLAVTYPTTREDAEAQHMSEYAALPQPSRVYEALEHPFSQPRKEA